MKKAAYGMLFVYTVANAALLSLGIECLLNLLASVMAVSLDAPSAAEQYPRFLPFCMVLGIVALLGLVAVLILNIKSSERLVFTKSAWIFEYVLAAVLSMPMIKLWEMLFDFLHKAFS